MSDKTAIEWTDATWNPVTGCTEVSPGCDHCYAKTFAERWRGTEGHYFERGFDVQLRPDKLEQPLKWKRARRIFVNSMSDLFHDEIPDEYIADVFTVMACNYLWDRPTHTFQVLTKRHARMRSLLSSEKFRASVAEGVGMKSENGDRCHDDVYYRFWPLPNVWLGVSAENQQWADIRIPALLETPAAVRFLSAEPLLGPIDLDNCGGYQAVRPATPYPRALGPDPCPDLTYLDWVIVGGESGPGARPMCPTDAIILRDQCRDAGVAFLFKQWGGRTPKAGGRELDGRTWDQYPELVTS